MLRKLEERSQRLDSEQTTHQDDDTETTSGEEQVDPRLNLVNLNIEPRGDYASLVQTTVQLDDNLV